MHRAVADRHQHFHATIEIAAHPIGRGNEYARAPVGQGGAIAERPDAAVLQETADDRFHCDPFRKPGHARPQAADAAHHQGNVHAFLRCGIEPLDQATVGQRVELGPDRGRLAGAGKGNLALDAIIQRAAQADGRDREELGVLGLDIAGDEIEQLPGIAPRLGIGGEERQVGIDARGHRVIIAGAKVAVGAIAIALAPHHHRNLGVGLPVDKAIDHLNPGALQLARPVQILLLVEPRFQFDHGGDGLARLGRGDQRGDHGRLLAGAIERLLDRHHVGIFGSLAQEIDHHVEAFERVVDHQILFADRGKAIAIVFQHAFGIARVIGFEFQFRARHVDDLGKAVHRQQAARFHHQGVVQSQLVAQQLFGGGIEIILQLQHDHLAAPAPLDCRAEIAHQVFGVFLDFHVAVAQHAERARTLDAKAGKHRGGIAAHQFLDADPAAIVGQAHKARQRRRHQDHLGHRVVIGHPHHRKQDARALVGDERKRVRRIDRLWGEHRHDMLGEIARQPIGLGTGQGLVPHEVDAGLGQKV